MNSTQMYSAINSINSQANAIDATGLLNHISSAADLNYQRSQIEANRTREWQEVQNAKAMQFNAQQAQANRDWQEMMSNTAHQREVRDLLNAGLNPVLSASGGNGASVTSGATASGVTSSGATAQPDTAMSGAIANLFGSLISSITSLANQSTSALSNLAVAEKNGEISKLVTSMNNYSALQVAKEQASASRYGADRSYFASKYASDTQKYIAQHYPNTLPAVLDRYLGALLGGFSGEDSTIGTIEETTEELLYNEEVHKRFLRLMSFGLFGRDKK